MCFGRDRKGEWEKEKAPIRAEQRSYQGIEYGEAKQKSPISGEQAEHQQEVQNLRQDFAQVQGENENLQQRVRDLERQLEQQRQYEAEKREVTQPAVQIAPVPRQEEPQPPKKRPSEDAIRVPVFCLKNPADIPDIIEVLNGYDQDEPYLSFSLESNRSITPTRKELAVVLALCSTDRLDITDRELLQELRVDKGYKNVLMVVLRRGTDPSKFKTNHDSSIDSGVGEQKAILQFIFHKGQILMDEAAQVNISNLAIFFKLAKRAFTL